MHIHPTQTPSWPTAQAAKTAWDAARTNPGSTPQQKQAACDAYRAAVKRCLKECGLSG